MGDSDAGTRDRRRKRSRPPSEKYHVDPNLRGICDSGSDTETTAPKVAATRRGRGGKTAGSGNGGAERKKGKGLRPSVSLESFLKDTGTSTATVCYDTDATEGPDLPKADPAQLDAEQLRALAGQAVASILLVASKSGHLQGPFVKRLRDAAASLQDVVGVLAGRTEDSEARRLRIENGRLRQEIEQAKIDLKVHRTQCLTAQTSTMEGPNPSEVITVQALQKILLEFKASMFASLGTMMDAKIEGLEDRLLPSKNLRPPLAADCVVSKPNNPSVAPRRKKGVTNRVAVTPAAPIVAASLPAPLSSGRTEEFPPLPQPRLTKTGIALHAATPAAPVTVPPQDSWNLVAKKPKKKRQPASATAIKKIPVAQTTNKKEPKIILEAPKSAAVIIRLRPEAEAKGLTYQQVLQNAEAKVDIKDLGFDKGLRYKVAATGARMLELPDTDGNKAEKLVERLRAALEGVAWVTRPIKRGEIRLTELGDSATRESVRAAVAKVGRISEDLIKVLEIRRGPGGTGTTVVECPVAVAKELASARELLVGWGSAKVTPLEQRPLRCFKCMGLGHTRQTCPSESERGGQCCYRCGSKEHRSWDCLAEKVCCAICSEAGLPADHVMGGRSCVPPTTKGKRVGVAVRRATSVPQGQTQEETEMSE